MILHAAAHTAPALPECPLCGRPVRRATAAANAGCCTACVAVTPLALFDSAARSKGDPRDAR